MKTLHTLELTQDGLTVKATQRYNANNNTGHYDYVITSGAGHIFKTGQTTGGPPTGKLNDGDLIDILRYATRWLDDEDFELYGLTRGTK